MTYYSATPLDQNGNTPSSAIKKKYTFLTKYRFGSGPLRWFYIGGGVSHYGGSPGTGFPWMPAYTLYDAFGGYKKDKSHWSVSVSANNLLNKKDYLVGSEATFAAYLGAPLMVKMAIGYTW